jgi:hypothetical protein
LHEDTSARGSGGWEDRDVNGETEPPAAGALGPRPRFSKLLR